MRKQRRGSGPPAGPPALALCARDLHALKLGAFQGQPLVLAFLGKGGGITTHGMPAAELESARAELRGLGAALVLVSPAGLWGFGPDDETRLVAAPGDLDPGVIGALRTRCGVAQHGSAVFVLDEDLSVEFANVADPAAEASFRAVVDALAAAGRAVIEARTSAFTLTRRQLVMSSLVSAFALVFLGGCATTAAPSPAAPPAAADEGDLQITLDVNGTPRTVRIDPRVTLLDALRERLGLTGTKKGCDQGQCGACTVLVDGRRVNACLTLAVRTQGVPITTIEGVARGETLHPLQAAFIAEDGFQCGYCTSGQIMSALGMLAEHRGRVATGDGRTLTDDDVREQMSGNICRCGAYPNIVAAIRRARKEL